MNATKMHSHKDTLEVVGAAVGWAIMTNLATVDLVVKIAGGLLFIAFTGYKLWKEWKGK